MPFLVMLLMWLLKRVLVWLLMQLLMLSRFLMRQFKEESEGEPAMGPSLRIFCHLSNQFSLNLAYLNESCLPHQVSYNPEYNQTLYQIIAHLWEVA